MLKTRLKINASQYVAQCLLVKSKHQRSLIIRPSMHSSYIIFATLLMMSSMGSLAKLQLCDFISGNLIRFKLASCQCFVSECLTIFKPHPGPYRPTQAACLLLHLTGHTLADTDTTLITDNFFLYFLQHNKKFFGNASDADHTTDTLPRF